ncbi:MAG: hypothetical protein IAE78_28780 [Myxococcus sp.]|nr:hypothetical protein [Myxococcus sp.]
MTCSTSCALPFVATTQPRVSADAPVTVKLEPQLEVERAEVVFQLTFTNASDELLVVNLEALRLGDGAVKRASADVAPPSLTVLPGLSFFGSSLLRVGGLTPDGPVPERFLVVLARSERTVALRGPLEAAPLEVRFHDAVFALDGSVFTPAPLPLVTSHQPLTNARPSAVRVGARLLGGAIVGVSPPAPLSSPRAEVITWTGVFEGFIGAWTRWVEAQLVLRPGFGRVVGVEVGVRPGVEALTLLAGYGFDAYQVRLTPQSAGAPLLGHGPRFSVDFAFDTPLEALGVRRPKRFGVFVTAGWSFVPSQGGATLLLPIVEGGLRLRLL